jgi:hypothetical protein
LTTPFSENAIQSPSTPANPVSGFLRSAGKAIYNLCETALHAVRKGYDDFHMRIAEGNYRVKPKSLWTLITGQGSKPEIDVVATKFGGAMMDTGRSFGKRMMWASAIALVSMQAMVWVAGGIALAGAGLFFLEYMQSRRAGREIIREVNFAGQEVEGTRADLYHLHNAQEKIMNLGGTFAQASMESTSETIERIINSVADNAARVKVVDAGRYNAGCDGYEFSEPGIKLVKNRPTAPVIFHATATTHALADMSVKSSFDAAAAYTPEEVARRFLALEEALPPDAMAKVNEVRAQKAKTPQARAA